MLFRSQKAVRKARLSEVATVYNTITRGIDMWLLGNGGYPSSEVWFSGSNKDVELDVNTAWTEETGGHASYTKTGYWQFECSTNACYMSFFGNDWLDNNIYWHKTPNSEWKLYNFAGNSKPTTPELCRWWRGLYGPTHMTDTMITACAAY